MISFSDHLSKWPMHRWWDHSLMPWPDAGRPPNPMPGEKATILLRFHGILMGRSSEYQRNIIRMGFSWDFHGDFHEIDEILMWFYWDFTGIWMGRSSKENGNMILFHASQVRIHGDIMGIEWDVNGCLNEFDDPPCWLVSFRSNHLAGKSYTFIRTTN